MSKSAAIQTAVWTELALESKPLPLTGQEVMGADYKYDQTTIRGFLFGVATLLTADTPSYTFLWATLDPELCLNDTVISLCGYIASVTT